MILRKKRREYYTALLFMVPWILGFIIFTGYPLAYSLFLSFTKFNLFSTPEFVGFRNYINIFMKDKVFVKSVSVTVKYVIFSVPLQLVLALLLAILLNRKIIGIGLFRGIFYIPSLLGGCVAIAILWRIIFNSEGLFNQLLMAAGIDAVEGLSWYSNPKVNIWTLIALRIWQFGSPMIIFLASLKQIPSMLYESARIDGASMFTQFNKITLPFLSPIILFNLIMQMNSAFQTFSPAYIISGGTGGHLNSLLFYTLYLYRSGFIDSRMGYASSLAWILVLTISIISFLVFRSSNKWVFYNE